MREGVHEWCIGCMKNCDYFERFCPGINADEEWSSGKCELMRREARRRWEEYQLSFRQFTKRR